MLLPWFDRTDVNAYVLSAAVGGLLITGSPATLRAGRELPAGVGSVKITGSAANLRVARQVNAATGGITIGGSAASLRSGRTLSAAVGSETITGSAASLRVGRSLSASIGSEVINGVAVDLVYTPDVAAVLDASPGQYVLTGAPATLTYTPIPPPPELVAHLWGTPNRGRRIASFARFSLDAQAGHSALRGVGADLVVTRKGYPRGDEEALLLAMLL